MEEKNTGYFESDPGRKSSSRLNATIVIWVALVLAAWIVIVGTFVTESSLLAASASGGTIFITIAGPAMVFMFNQKRAEINEKKPA